MAAKLEYDGSQESKEGIFAILDDWREKGHFNMFEAPRQLRSVFKMSKQDSYDVFSEWAENFGKE